MTQEVRKKAAIWLALVFILGIATGGVFGYSFARKSYAAGRPAPVSDAEHRAKKVAEMTEQVGLTPDQAQKCDAIIAATQAQIRTMRDKNNADVDAARHAAREQMRTVLTPEQMPKFEAYVTRIDAERKKQQEMMGPGPH
jgi:Spy/CpxP family protein refolding chaperone